MFRTSLLALAVVAGGLASAQAGRIVVASDEWLLSDFATTEPLLSASDVETLPTNIASYLTGGSGEILIRSDNFGLTGEVFLSALLDVGYTVTINGSASLATPDLSSYDAVFLAGNYPSGIAEVSGLVEFVDAGGGVYVAGGTGVGGAAFEAASWNAFLNVFGLAFDQVYNGFTGASEADIDFLPLFSGVGFIYENNGQDVRDLDPTDPSQFNLCNFPVFGGCDRPILSFAVYDSDLIPTPEPAALALFGLGALALGVVRRRR